MNVGTLMTELATALGSIPDLRAHAFPVGRIVPPVALVMLPDEITFDATYGRGSDSLTLDVDVLVGRADARPSVARLAEYLSGSGTRSIKAAIDGGTYTAASTVTVATATVGAFTVGTVVYAGATFTLNVTGSGG